MQHKIIIKNTWSLGLEASYGFITAKRGSAAGRLSGWPPKRFRGSRFDVRGSTGLAELKIYRIS